MTFIIKNPISIMIDGRTSIEANEYIKALQKSIDGMNYDMEEHKDNDYGFCCWSLDGLEVSSVDELKPYIKQADDEIDKVNSILESIALIEEAKSMDEIRKAFTAAGIEVKEVQPQPKNGRQNTKFKATVTYANDKTGSDGPTTGPGEFWSADIEGNNDPLLMELVGRLNENNLGEMVAWDELVGEEEAGEDGPLYTVMYAIRRNDGLNGEWANGYTYTKAEWMKEIRRITKEFVKSANA